ncbi:MAG: DNA helicase PcrA [Pseudanabaenaceae cyanobacterium bins.39]|nr:DNA helicase PcrA [Pseudanabaenaceae cyanobacterium bins.39]
MSSNFLHHLNHAQQKAASHLYGPMLVVAGAGSGKTRTLTYRIANLLLNHDVSCDQVLAVTFTNKAAKEMNERIQSLLVQEVAQRELGKSLTEINEWEQDKIRRRVYKRYINSFAEDGLWMGTFHSMCCRILRADINKYKDIQGRSWGVNFSIFDDSDAQALIKDIVINQVKLDEKKFDPRSVRFAIGNAKNKGWTPEEYEQQSDDAPVRRRAIAQVYRLYQNQLATNNALDFDDLIFLPVRLFQQNPEVLHRWHDRFKHILVDEYQDTNRTQYELIRLLSTNNSHPQWNDRSIFAVGDADQSIYSFRSADFTILMEFQEAFGDRLPDAHTKTMIKLEENYRSVANILEIANQLIDHNSQRIDKILKATRPEGDLIELYRAEDEVDEAQFVIEQIRRVKAKMSEANLGHFAILYRTNAQSRPFEESLVRWNIPYKVVGGLRFYDRKEIKDIMAYLRLLSNPADTLSLMRIINVPKRSIGKATLDKFQQAAQELGVPIWEIINEETTVKTLAGRSAKGVLSFVELIENWRSKVGTTPAADIIQGIIAESGYGDELKVQGTDEASDRLANLQELYNAAVQFAEENEDASLDAFLANAALASSLDDSDPNAEKVTLMTLHAAKGLEFPVVFLVGLEQGLFPSFRSLNDVMALEEERRLMYVGITRAQEKLFLSHAQSRRLYGNREYAIPSQFLNELPKEYLTGHGIDKFISKASQRAEATSQKGSLRTVAPAKVSNVKPKPMIDWQVGDRVMHDKFGEGKVSNLLGTGEKMFLAIAFAGQGKKIIDPKIAPIQKI